MDLGVSDGGAVASFAHLTCFCIRILFVFHFWRGIAPDFGHFLRFLVLEHWTLFCL